MTTWNCAECGTPRAVGVVNCPQCGTERAPFRENGEGPIFDLVDVTGLDRVPSTDFVPALREVRDSADSGTTQVPERTEETDNAKDQ